MIARRRSLSLTPTLDKLEEYCLLSHAGVVSTLSRSVAPLVQNQGNDGAVAHSRPIGPHATAELKATGLVHAATTYTKGPVNSTGTYKTRFDNKLRFFYAPLTTFSTSSINSAVLALTAKPLNGTSSHNTGDYYVTPAVGKSFVVAWNNQTASRYDWIAVKYLGNGLFATLDRLGASTNLGNGATFTRNYTSGGSTVSIILTNPTGSTWFANDVTYSLKFKNA